MGAVVCGLSVATLAATSDLGGTAGLVSAAVAYVVLFAGLAVTSVLSLELTHNAVTAAERTTLTSISSLSLQSGGVAANLTLGALAAQAGLAAAWTVAAAITLVSALLFVRLPVLTRSSPAPAPQVRSGSD